MRRDPLGGKQQGFQEKWADIPSPRQLCVQVTYRTGLPERQQAKTLNVSTTLSHLVQILPPSPSPEGPLHKALGLDYMSASTAAATLCNSNEKQSQKQAKNMKLIR